MDKAIITLEMSLKEFNLVRKMLGKYDERVTVLSQKDLGKVVNEKIAKEKQVINELLENLGI